MSYRVEVQLSAERDFDHLPAKAQGQVFRALAALEENPRPPGIVALKGKLKGRYRLRTGDFRISYSVEDKAKVVRVWQIGNRDKFYNQARRRNTG